MFDLQQVKELLVIDGNNRITACRHLIAKYPLVQNFKKRKVCLLLTNRV